MNDNHSSKHIWDDSPISKELVDILIDNEYNILDVEEYRIIISKNTPDIDIVMKKYSNYLKAKSEYERATAEILFFANAKGGYSTKREKYNDYSSKDTK